MRPLVTMRQAIEDKNLLGDMLDGPSWDVWKALLIASRGEPLTEAERLLYEARTGRETTPTEPVEEAAMIGGRRSGKTVAAAVAGTYLSALCDWSDVLRPGERGVLLYLAQTQKTAKVAFRYCEAKFDENKMLRKLVTGKTQDSISLKTGIDLEIRPASFRGLRGITTIGVIADEIAFWFSDETSANPDTEILTAVRPALATTGGPIIMISSPYAKRGELFETYRRHYGPGGDPNIMVAQGASRDFNPTLKQSVVDRAIERDPTRFKAEYLGQFRDDVAGFVTREAVEACVENGVRERPPQKDYRYFGFVDPSGGSSDSMTMAIAHKAGDTAILDVVREIKPPFSPEAAVLEFAALLKTYRVSQVSGDRYAGEWCREPFQRAGIFYDPNARPKSDLYRDLLPLINSKACALLDNERMLSQISGLDRRIGRSGRDIIDHPPGLHDDVANAVAGAVTLTAAESAMVSSGNWKFTPRMVA
jgi:hypothetical protein